MDTIGIVSAIILVAILATMAASAYQAIGDIRNHIDTH